MLLQKGCILMFQLDNKIKYTWKEEWNIPYESLWGRLEKFRAVNVLDQSQIDKIIRIGGNDISYSTFAKQFLIYRGQKYNVKRMDNWLCIDTKIFDNYTRLDGIFDRRVRYCPVCIKLGYHSYFHQLFFLDTCFIHREKLVYRCSCSNTYVLRRKEIKKAKAFQCEVCGENICDAPLISDAIINMWWKNKLNTEHIHQSNIYKKVNVIDITQIMPQTYSKSISCIQLNKQQKIVLRELLLNGSTQQNPQLYINPDDENKTEPIIMSDILIKYILNEYSVNTILEHYWNISNRYYNYNIEKYDIKLITILYLLKELQCISYIDQLGLDSFLQNLNIEVGDLINLFDADNKYSDAIKFAEYSLDSLNLKSELYARGYNYILKEFVKSRYEHIYNCLKTDYPQKYPHTSDAYISFENWNYPVYVIIKTMKDEMLLF